MKPILLKVLTKDMMSPTSSRPLKWEIGVKHSVKNFNTDPNEDCGFPRLYATEIEGLPYTFRVKEGHRVFEVKVGGKNVNINPCKRGWSVMMPVREVFKDELIALAIAKEPELGYKLSQCIFPVNPLALPAATLTDRHIDLLKQWSAARSAARSAAWDAARSAAWAAACDAVRFAAWDAARSAAWAAVCDAARAYTLSLFPNIIATFNLPDATLRAIDAIAELWEGGVIPLYYNKKWQLTTGADSHVIWEGVI
jgi:hypothetical protein